MLTLASCVEYVIYYQFTTREGTAQKANLYKVLSYILINAHQYFVVANISFDTTEEQLSAVLSEIGYQVRLNSVMF